MRARETGPRLCVAGIEFGVVFDGKILDGAAGEIARGDELRLAGGGQSRSRRHKRKARPKAD